MQILMSGFKFQDIDWDSEWFPRIVFFNALGIDKMQKGHKLIYEDGDDIPYAYENFRVTGTFRENLELYNFPLDYQVSSWFLNKTILDFQKCFTAFHR